jgi:hypothetical protein
MDGAMTGVEVLFTRTGVDESNAITDLGRDVGQYFILVSGIDVPVT